MTNKPSWAFWFLWLTGYMVLDLILAALLHGSLAWQQVPGALEGAVAGASITTFFALWRWYKAQDRF